MAFFGFKVVFRCVSKKNQCLLRINLQRSKSFLRKFKKNQQFNVLQNSKKMKNIVRKSLKEKTSNIFKEEWYDDMVDFIHHYYTVGELFIEFNKFLPQKFKRGKGIIVTNSELKDFCDEHHSHPVSPKMASTQFMRYLASEGIQFKRKNTGGQRYFEITF